MSGDDLEVLLARIDAVQSGVTERIDSLERGVKAQIRLLDNQMASHRARLGELEATVCGTPLPELVGGRATTGRASGRARRWRLLELGLQLLFVLLLVLGGGLLLGRGGQLDVTMVVGLGLVALGALGRDARQLLGLSRGQGQGSGSGAVLGALLLVVSTAQAVLP